MAVRALRPGSPVDAPAPSPCFGIGARRRDGPFELADLRPELPEQAVAPHEHEEGHFVLVLEGLYLSSAAGAPSVAAGPLLIWNPPGTMHRDRFRGDGRFVAIGLAPGEAAALPPVPACLDGGARPAALRTAAALSQADADLAGLCWELVAAAAPDPAPARAPSWLARAREMIDDRIGERLRLADVAAETGVHPVHLARTFRATFGCAPSDYQLFRRLAAARGMIAATRLPLVEIALRAGFADQSHFTRAFTRRFGLPPGAFRAAMLQ